MCASRTSLRETPHLWALSYDNTPEIRLFYHWAHVTKINARYSVAGYKSASGNADGACPAAGAFAACVVEALAPASDGKPVTKPVLMKAITATGWATDDTLLATDPVWLEAGRFDDRGTQARREIGRTDC